MWIPLWITHYKLWLILQLLIIIKGTLDSTTVAKYEVAQNQIYIYVQNIKLMYIIYV